MPRHINVSLALILGLAAALNTTPLLAMQDEEQQCLLSEQQAQELGFEFDLDCQSDFFFGLEFAEGRETGSPEALYDVRFVGEPGKETGAYIPERFNSEAMVVRVLSGNFAFRTQGAGVIVDPQGQPLERYTASVSLAPGQNPNDREPGVESEIREFTVNEDVPFSCDLNLHERMLCLLNQEEVEEFADEVTFVRLDPGDTVYLPSNSTCFLCNTERLDPTTGEIVESGGEPAELLIWSSTTGFSGALENLPQDSSQVTPAAQGSGRFVGWMFNPGSSCK